MGELINGRTPEKILFNIRECAYGACLSECPYDGSDDCTEELLKDALALIRHLEAKQPKWISVEERLPEPYQCVIVHVQHTPKYRGDTPKEDCWHVVEEDCWLGDGWDCNADEEIHEITHWMPLPEPPKEEE